MEFRTIDPADGTTVTFDGLIIATGVRLRDRLRPGRTLVVVGTSPVRPVVGETASRD